MAVDSNTRQSGTRLGCDHYLVSPDETRQCCYLCVCVSPDKDETRLLFVFFFFLFSFFFSPLSERDICVEPCMLTNNATLLQRMSRDIHSHHVL